MNAGMTRPAPESVAERAREILAALEADPEFERLRTGCAAYNKDWQSFMGYALVDGFNLSQDTAPLFVEALRASAMKSAVFEMTGGDEWAAELPVPVAVDEMIHAQAAQVTVLSRMQKRTGVQFVHATDREQIGGWDHGDYTHQVYRAAWGPVPERYWFGKTETARRSEIARQKYEPLGIFEGGRRFAPGFATSS